MECTLERIIWNALWRACVECMSGVHVWHTQFSGEMHAHAMPIMYCERGVREPAAVLQPYSRYLGLYTWRRSSVHACRGACVKHSISAAS